MGTRRFFKSIKAKILTGFGFAIIVLLTAGGITYQSFKDLVSSLDFLAKPDVKLVKLNNILSDLSLSENSIRSYFITSEEKYLDKYWFYSSRFERSIDSLSRITNDFQIDSDKIKKVVNLWREKKNYTYELIDLYSKKQEKRLPDGILQKLNEENPDLPTIIITKTIIKKNIEVPPKIITKNTTEEKRSFLSRLFKRKEKTVLETDTIYTQPATVKEEITMHVDTIYTGGQANEVKEKAFRKILTSIRKYNSKYKNKLKESESKIINKDIGLIEYIRNIVIDLKNSEQKITETNVKEAKEIVEVSIIKIFLFGVSGISTILVLGFLLMSDVAKTNYQQNKLLGAKVKAEELVKAKEDFLAMMSHEIRTPLNSIVGFTEQLSKTKLLNRQKYYLQAVSDSSAHLLSLVNDILDHSQIEAGKIDFENITFSLKEVIEEVYDAFYIKATEKNLLLTYSVNEDEQLLNGDPLRLKQILFNLLSNAVKFTESGSVSIDCEQMLLNEDEINVSISVLDTGVGIPAHKIDNIFETFRQADSSISRKYGGTGLGLAISKKLVNLQGGEISVNSTEGKGSEFTFNIKYKKSRSKPLPKLTPETPNPDIFEGMKVLIVEDDEFNLLLFHTILTKWKVKVRMVSTGEEALQTLRREPFDLVITDIHIPGMSGLDLFKAIKLHVDKKVSEIPVLAVTANVIKQSMRSFKNSGFSEVLFKPFKEEQLAKAMLRATGKEIKASNTQIELSKDQEPDQNIFSDFIKFSDGNPEEVHRMVDAFINNSSRLLDSLKTNLEEKQWDELREVAHKLIPGFGHIQNYEMTELLSEIENYLEQAGTPDEVKIEEMVNLALDKGYKQIKVLEEEITKIV